MFGLVFVAPLVLIFAAIESIVAWSWSPFVLGSVASAGLLVLAKSCQRIRPERFENTWIFLNLGVASLMGLVFLGANSILTGTNPIFPGYASLPLYYTYSVSSCQATHLVRAACLSYDPVLILVEYLFWTLVAFGFVSAVNLVVTRFTARVRDRTS